MVELQTGTFVFNHGAELDGSFNAASGTLVSFNGSHNYTLNALSETGEVQMNSGYYNIGPLVSRELDFYGGTIVSNMVLNGTLNWYGGGLGIWKPRFRCTAR